MARILISISMVTVIFFTAAAVRAEILLDRVVAVVNQEVITWSELYKNMETDASQQLKEIKNEDRLKIFRENESLFLENLINLKLQLQEAVSLGFGITDEEVKEGIDAVMKKYGMNDAQFRESLGKEGYTFDEYRRRFREQILVSKIVNHQIRSKIIVTDNDVQQYIKDMVGRGENTASYHISQIFFKRPLTDEGVKAVEAKAAEVLALLKEGGNFKELAAKHSEDVSASAGGDIGLLKQAQLMKEFAAALENMKIDEVSKPFWTDRGLHIIRLEGKAEARGQKELEEFARKELSDRLFAERYNAWVKSMREKAFIEIRL